MARSISSNQAAPSSMPVFASTFSSRLRSLSAMPTVHAAWAIPASSSGKTHIVRRIACMRTSVRSS